jgi:hypothetical protein|tara:strand:- start:1850 stop:2167 length:318 start_codon:yes stop_codon:yes gene_type:complete
MDELSVGNSLNIGEIISTYGFPIIAAAAMGYFIFFIWKWVTDQVDPVIGDSHMTLIALIDRVRMLDNDLIRLNAKLDMILQEQERNEAASNSTTKSKSKFSKSGK